MIFMRLNEKQIRLIFLLAILAGVFGCLNFTNRNYEVYEIFSEEQAREMEQAAKQTEQRVENVLPAAEAANNNDAAGQNTKNGTVKQNTNSGSSVKQRQNKPAGKDILLNVPFAAQAPFGEWSDPRQQDGCEEVSVLMAMRWVNNRKTISKDEAKKEILAISDYEEKTYGSYHDTSAADTVSRIIKGYYNYDNASVEYNINAEDIISELEKGDLIIVPANGQKLGNPNFTAPGPDRHMLIIKDYDASSDEFITNDPGTRQGENYRYKSDVLINALRDYPTGNHLPIEAERKAMIIIKKK